jgi:hypothetical protein
MAFLQPLVALVESKLNIQRISGFKIFKILNKDNVIKVEGDFSLNTNDNEIIFY